MPRAVTILLIETSAGERRRLSDAFATGAGMAVVGTAWTASSAKALAHDLAPDAIVIGGAPGKDPLALVVSIMESAAAPIIVIGGPLMPRSETQRLLHAGAVAVAGVPEGTGVERIVNTRRATDPRLVAIHSAARGRRDVDAHRSDLHRAFSRSGIARPVRSAS